MVRISGESATLKGGYGDDLLTGGDGLDIFVFSQDTGSDVVTDFSPSEDIIEISGTEPYESIGVEVVDGNTIITYGDSVITLQGVELDTEHAINHIVFTEQEEGSENIGGFGQMVDKASQMGGFSGLMASAGIDAKIAAEMRAKSFSDLAKADMEQAQHVIAEVRATLQNLHACDAQIWAAICRA